MDQRQVTKERERRFVQRFLRVLGREELVLNLEDDEGPDFRVGAPEGRIGIEVTELFRETVPGKVPRQATERGWAQVASEAETLWTRQGRPFVRVNLLFHPDYHVPQRSATQLAARIVNLVDRYLPDQDSSIGVWGIEQPPGQFPVELVQLAIARSGGLTKSRWVCRDAGFVAELAPEQIQAAIDAKGLDAEAYRQAFDSIWLLLVIYQRRMSSEMDTPTEAASHEYHTPVNRLFVFSTADERIVELRQVIRQDSRRSAGRPDKPASG